MFREIKVGDKTVAMLANGATPLFYKQLFKKDLLKLFSNKGEEMVGEQVSELAFIMAMQAKEGMTAAEMMKLSYDAYIEWLSQFEPLDLTMSGGDITLMYVSDSVPSAMPKKKVNGKAKE